MFEVQELIPAELIDLLPISTTRAETALSRFPIHNLTKSEKIDIRIIQKGEAGETGIYWSVSPSRDFGEPRQLAYKLDTLVINRRIDEALKPIPKVIRLGSLREICKELGLSSGKSAGDVKTALQQNASAFITAKVSFRGNDGSEQRFEASFTRYGLRFFGQSLPNGKRADAVYIILNDEYSNLLNRAQFRPLNYDYLRQLTPSAQRFYEILSFKVFAALSQGRNHARLRYSEYCTRAPQRRYLDGTQMRKQMYKIHRPHVKSTYIADIEYRSVIDDVGEPDWDVMYVPGRKARAEYLAFTRNLRGEPRKKVGELTSPRPADCSEPLVLTQLTSRGITEKQAQKLLAALPATQAVAAQLKWADGVIAASKGSIRNPPGFYIHILRENILPPAPPAPCERPRKAPDPAAKDDSRRAHQIALLERHIKDELGEARFGELVTAKANQIWHTFNFLQPDLVQQVAESSVRSVLLKSLPSVPEEVTPTRKGG